MLEAIERDSMQYDVVIVGAGPSGLSAAITDSTLASLTITMSFMRISPSRGREPSGRRVRLPPGCRRLIC